MSNYLNGTDLKLSVNRTPQYGRLDAAGNKERPKTTADVVATIGAAPPAILCTGCYFLTDRARAMLAFNVSVAG